jgi:hypothetical protein
MDNNVNLNIGEMIKFPDYPSFELPMHRHNWHGSQRMIPFIKLAQFSCHSPRALSPREAEFS